MCGWEDTEKEGDVAVESGGLVTALLIETTTCCALERRDPPIEPLCWVDLVVIESEGPLWRGSCARDILLPRALSAMQRHGTVARRKGLLDSRHKLLGSHLHRLGDNDGGSNRVKFVRSVASDKVFELGVFGKQLCDSVLEFGDLGELAELGFVGVEVGVKRFGFV